MSVFIGKTSSLHTPVHSEKNISACLYMLFFYFFRKIMNTPITQKYEYLKNKLDLVLTSPEKNIAQELFEVLREEYKKATEIKTPNNEISAINNEQSIERIQTSKTLRETLEEAQSLPKENQIKLEENKKRLEENELKIFILEYFSPMLSSNPHLFAQFISLVGEIFNQQADALQAKDDRTYRSSVYQTSKMLWYIMS